MRRSPELRVGLLGAGMIASYGWGVMPGMAAVDSRARIEAIAAPSRRHSEPLAQKYAIPFVFDSLTQMLEGTQLDAVVNLTPGPIHFESSRRILEAGLHLVTEKPLSNTVLEADKLIQIATERDLTIICSPPRMIEPQRRRTKELVATGAIGQVAFARVRSSHAGPAAQAWPTDPSWFYAEGAGPLLDIGAYGIHEITGILGSARSVIAMSGRLTRDRLVHGGPFGGNAVQVEVDDNVLLLLDLGESRFVVVDATFSVRAARSPEIEIFGLEGTIALPNLRLQPEEAPIQIYQVGVDGVGGEWSDARGEGFDRAQELTRARGRASLVQHLVECVLDGRKNELTAEHGRHTLEIMLSAQESAKTGSAVKLLTRVD